MTALVSAAYDVKGNFNDDRNAQGPYTSPVILLNEGQPLILLPSGTNISSTGQINPLSSSLTYTPTGVVQVYCFGQTGLPAGMYYARFSSPSNVQLYLDPEGTITPTGITPQAYAGGTALTPILRIPVPGKLLGPNGSLRYDIMWGCNNSAGSKSMAIYFGGQYFGAQPATTIISNRSNGVIRNRNNERLQLQSGSTLQTGFGNSSQAPTQVQVDTTVDQFFELRLQVAVSSDVVWVDGITLEALYGI